ncbi:GntR family transcriptional regulator [Pararoseomonas indoligenes]|uniref:GntR family transcriptional regulator n=1 Tax=Roseomonas indoligenes TaxID=2820811 RepID=A0A940MYC9_9PROT|nr:GntR family transcriptional regulator [Pararoseomonas indoligenes]MBP0493290.1 GntR family transcriptional regulator [Pararoseomonas indoligenes]
MRQEPLSVTGGETLASALRRRLEADIADGRLDPGTRLDEQDVAQRFGVSRTPVREAFRLLASDRLVELRGRQGAVVRSIGVHTLIEMFQVMGELEGLCARLAARRASPRQLERMTAIHARLEAAAESGPDLFYDVNQEFHEAIYEASCNVFLAEETRKLRNRVATYRRRVTRMPDRIRDTIREHAEIMDAIAGRDPERAHSVMRSHLTLLGDNLLDFIAAFE